MSYNDLLYLKKNILSHRGRSGSYSNRAHERELSHVHYSSDDSEATDETPNRSWPHNGHSTEALNNIIIFGLKKHITEADVRLKILYKNKTKVNCFNSKR